MAFFLLPACVRACHITRVSLVFDQHVHWAKKKSTALPLERKFDTGSLSQEEYLSPFCNRVTTPVFLIRAYVPLINSSFVPSRALSRSPLQWS